MKDTDRRQVYKPGGGKRKKQKQTKWPLVVAAVLMVLAIAGVLLWWFLLRPPVAPPATSLPEASSLPQASSSSEAPQSVPEPEPAQPPVPEFIFTPEELALLDGMLAGWAAQGAPTPEGEEPNPAYGNGVSVYFCDLETGLEYVYNGETKYLIASLNKAPYAMYLYTLVEKGEASLDETYYITREMMAPVMGNTGRMKEDETLPRDYTLDELLYELIRYSDTGALRVLLESYGAEDYAVWAAGLGLQYPDDTRSVTNARITAVDAGVYLHALYGYMQEGVYGADLKEHMLSTRNHMIRSQYPVARKYGWDVESYHDMAVVYAPHPYLLAILTDKSKGTAAETEMFATITVQFETLLADKWAAWEAAQ